MERNDDDGNTAGERKEEVHDDSAGSDVESMSSDGEMITGSVAVEAFGCHVCAKPFSPPIFECPVGHFFCSPCRDNLPEDKCKFCSSGSTLTRSIGMERAVQAILVACRHATEHGCTEKPTYSDKDAHEKACPHAPCLCPEPSCGFAGRAAPELLAHLTGGELKWPSTMFQYKATFDVCIDEPGTHVLNCEDDDGMQLFLLRVQPAAQPPGRAVSLVWVPPLLKPTGFGCTVSFSCSKRHRGTSTVDDLRALRVSDWPPVECICVLPKVISDGGTSDAAVVLTITIVCADDPDDEDDDPSNSDCLT